MSRVKVNVADGQVFGRLTVIREIEPRVTKSGNSIRRVLCECSCGNTKVVDLYELIRKNASVKSCGCLAREASRSNMIAYNKSDHKRSEYLRDKKELSEYQIKRRRILNIRNCMIKRCYYEKATSYKYYGARGITVCDEWLNNADAFVEWSLANGYQNNLSIDRINNDLSYSPDNCRWVTNKMQGLNMRRSIFIKNHQGEEKNINEWAELYGLSAGMLRQRYFKKKPTFIEDIIYPPQVHHSVELMYAGKKLTAKEIQAITHESLSTVYAKYKC